MSGNQVTEDLVETGLQHRADLYQFLGRAFAEELSEETLTMLASVEAPEAGTLSISETEDAGAEPLDGSEALKTFREEVAELDETARADKLEDLAGSYGTLFHMDTSKSVDPYESFFRNGGELYGESYTEVKKIMDELGYSGYEDHPEPADHVAFELDFMAYLGRGALTQYRDGNLEFADRYLNLQAEFLATHVEQWVPKLCEEITQKTDDAFYEAIARMTQSLIEREPEMIDLYRDELDTSA